MQKEPLKNIAVLTISYLYILLFVYAAVSKLLDFENFQVQLGQSPLLSAYTGFISYSVLIIELFITLLLTIPKSRYIGLLASFGLMLMFTAYIIIILNYSSFIPCSCGGILEKLNWREHLIFNIIFTVLAAIAVILTKNNFRTTLFLLAIALFGSSSMMILHLKSEYEMHRENPFIRRFIKGSSSKIAETKLKNYSQYFVGAYQNQIFLGDSQAPLYIVSYDTLLKSKEQHKIQLEREDFPFQSVQVKVLDSTFYVMDGTVPVIYKGNIKDWKAKLVMSNNNYYFSKTEIIDANTIAFRAQQLKTLDNILGVFSLTDTLKVDYAPMILQKQIDGFFDTDGLMLFDKPSQKLIYIYYYRNQFIVTDSKLNLLHRGNTIDTTSKAKLKVVAIKNTKQKKLASPPYLVNKTATVSNNLLFINSKLIGRYESKKMWKTASIIDIYNIEKKTYESSMYIYHYNEKKVSEMLIVNNNLFAIIGNQLHKYRLNRSKPNEHQ
jgi:uncharacterized membrane protein YphA (DoxX/SURF4 family)